MSESTSLPSPSSARPFAALQNSLDAFIINSVLSSPTPTTTSGAKEPLSLQTTSSNFRRFVQKAGPIFTAQDAVESVFRWNDVPQTLFFGSVWAFLCLYPFLIILLPNLILATILLSTYASRPRPLSSFSSSNNIETPKPFTLGPVPPAEGSVDYLANLQNIQIMMGNISTLSDLARSLLPYLTWQQPLLTLVLLQLTLLSSIFLFIISPYIPYRYLFLVIGECTLISTHPFTQSLLRTGFPVLQTQSSKFFRKFWSIVIEEDGILESELNSKIVFVEKFQIESRLVDNTWGGEVITGGELPKEDEEEGENGDRRWRWVSGLDWSIDLDGDWAGGKIDKDGWAYLNIDGTRSEGPSKTRIGQSRRRRLTRRAVKIL